jgi:myo-inositol-1(or 4)-monophosphatase
MHPINRPTLIEIEDLARQAGEILRASYNPRPGYEQKFQVTHKGEIDLVTEIDHRSEAFLIGEIRQRFPEHAIIAEESGSLVGNDCCRWYIDPIDGTINFAHGLPLFAVSIGYVEGDQIQMGAIYNPIADEMYLAEHGKGATLNGLPIRVSAASTLIESLLVTGFPYDIRTTLHNNLELYARLSLVSQGVRRLGTAALDLCYVAAGRVDGFWEMSLMAHDVAAGGLIAEEAGATVTTVYGEANYLTPRCSILVANPAIHPQLLAIIQETYPKDVK